MEKTFKKIYKTLAMVSIAFVVLLATAISLARYFMPSLDQYEQQITEYIAKELQLEVHFDTFAGDWYRFGPALKVTDIVLSTPDGHVVTEIDALYVSINIIASLMKQQIVPAYLNIIGMQLDLEQHNDKQITIANLPQSINPKDERQAFLQLLNKYTRVTIRRSQINLKNAEGNEMPIYLRRLVLSRVGQNHTLDVSLNLLNQPTRFEMVTKINGNLSTPEKLAISGYVKADDVVLDGYLKPYAYKDYTVHNGVVDLHAWFDWHDNTLQSLQAQTNLQQLDVYSNIHNKSLKPFDLTGEFIWKREASDKWSLASSDLQIGIDDKGMMPLATSFKIIENGSDYNFFADKIFLEPVAKTLLWSEQLSQPHYDLLFALRPKGDVEHVKINWQNQQWELGLHLHNVALHRTTDMPGIDNLSGVVLANPTSARIDIMSSNSTYDDPANFQTPLFFTQIQGRFDAQYNADQWQVKSEDFSLENHDLTVKSQLTINGGKSLETHIDVKAQIPSLNSTKLYRYLPVNDLTPDLANWFENSMKNGELEKIDLKINGPLIDLPFFDNGNGQFRIALNMNDLDLMFDSDWPMLEKINGGFLLTDRHIDIVFDESEIFDMPLYGVSGEIGISKEDTSWLHIHGETFLTLAQGLEFINVTPLAQTVGKNLSAFTFDMPATLTLDLKIPLDDLNAIPQVSGVVQVSEGEAMINDLQLKFTNVNGVLTFTENDLASNGIHAEFLGNPALLTMTPELKNNHHLTHYQLTGRANIDDIATRYPGEVWDYIKGGSDFTASFVIDNDSTDKGFDLTVASDLKGVEITLPAPLNKTSDQKIIMNYTTAVSKSADIQRIVYGNLFDAIAEFKEKDARSELVGARIQFGGPLKNLQIPQGIVATGNITKVSYDDWDVFIESANADANNEHEEPIYDDMLAYIKSIDVKVNEFDAFHFPFNNAKINLTQANQKWLLNMNSNEVKGRITIPQTDKAGILVLDLDYCNWNDEKHYEEQNNLNPKDLLAMSFSCQNFIYNQKSLGLIKFSIIPDAKGVEIKNLSMTRPNDKFTANGRWWVENNTQNSSFTGHLSSKALDQTLSLFDIKSTILDSQTEADFTLSWPQDPFDFDLARLNGELNVHLSNGRIVDVNPGFGRILSLLSIQAIGRRLRLDFSDVFKKGFSFDDITTHVKIKNGIAHSDDLTLSSPAADMNMKGNVNLGTKQLDLSAYVRINVTGSLPIAATIASGGNPIVGAVGVGVWAVDKIVKSAGGNLLSSSYHVTGTWENPQVK